MSKIDGSTHPAGEGGDGVGVTGWWGAVSIEAVCPSHDSSTKASVATSLFCFLCF